MAAEVYWKGRAPRAKSDGTPVARHVCAMMMCEGHGIPEDTLVRYGPEVALHRRGRLVPAHGRKALDSLASDAARLSREAGFSQH